MLRAAEPAGWRSGDQRENYVVATVAYNLLYGHLNLRRPLEKRLRQLGTDYIDAMRTAASMRSYIDHEHVSKTHLLLILLLNVIFSYMIANDYFRAKRVSSHPGPESLRAQEGFSWQSDSTAHFRIYYEPGSPAAQRRAWLQENAETSWQRVLSLVGEEAYAPIIHIFAVASPMRMKALIGREMNGTAFYKANTICCVVADEGAAAGSHEIAHVMAPNLWGWPETWINEGFAVYANYWWYGNDLHALAKYLLLECKLIPLKNLMSRFRDYPDLVSYPETGSFVGFLYEHYGLETIKLIWRNGIAEIPRITGKSVEELEKEWHEMVMKTDASKVRYEVDT